MQPVARRYTAFANMLAPQDLLTDQRHHDGVLGVMVRRIAVGDVLHGDAADELDDAGVVGLEHAVRVQVRGLQLAYKRFDHDLRRVEHGSNRMPATREYPDCRLLNTDS